MKVKLKNGKEVSIDLYKMTVAEIRKMGEANLPIDEGDELLAKAIGMTKEEIQSLVYPDYRKITKKFWEYARNPLQDEDDEKNSPSESTSE